MFQVHHGRGVGGIEQSTGDHPDVALEDQALPPVLGLDHDVVVGEGDEANSDRANRDETCKERPAKEGERITKVQSPLTIARIG